MTFENSPPPDWQQTELPLTPSAEDSPARTLARPERARAWPASGRGYGARSPDLLASYDPASSSWKTSQLCLDGALATFSGTWPRSGMMRSGTAYQLPPLVPLTVETASGLWATPTASPANGEPEAFLERKRRSVARGNRMGVSLTDLNMQVKAAARGLWPTPRANDAKKGGDFDATNPRNGLPAAVKMWPTPNCMDAMGPRSKEALSRAKLKGGCSNLKDVVGGHMNPTWVEWLMGFPLGWTDCGGSATPSSRKSSR